MWLHSWQKSSPSSVWCVLGSAWVSRAGRMSCAAGSRTIPAPADRLCTPPRCTRRGSRTACRRSCTTARRLPVTPSRSGSQTQARCSRPSRGTFSLSISVEYTAKENKRIAYRCQNLSVWTNCMLEYIAALKYYLHHFKKKSILVKSFQERMVLATNRLELRSGPTYVGPDLDFSLFAKVLVLQYPKYN